MQCCLKRGSACVIACKSYTNRDSSQLQRPSLEAASAGERGACLGSRDGSAASAAFFSLIVLIWPATWPRGADEPAGDRGRGLSAASARGRWPGPASASSGPCRTVTSCPVRDGPLDLDLVLISFFLTGRLDVLAQLRDAAGAPGNRGRALSSSVWVT